MKRFKFFSFLSFIGVTILYLLYMQSVYAKYDAQGPQISFGAEELSISVNTDEADLLRDVTAKDPQLGDVTESVIIEGYSSFTEKSTRLITYAAFGNNDKVVTKARKVTYKDYTAPRFSLSAPLIFYENGSGNRVTNLSAVSSLDGDITNKIKQYAVEEGQSLNFTTEGRYPVKFVVTDSAGGKSEVQLYVDILKNDGNIYNKAEIELKSYLLYLKVGETLDIEGNIEKVTVSGEEEPKWMDKVKIDTNLDLNKSGVYEVYYRLKAEDDISSVTKLIVVVE